MVIIYFLRTLNSKSEYRNPKQYRISNDKISKQQTVFWMQFKNPCTKFVILEHSNLEFVSYFEFRASDFRLIRLWKITLHINRLVFLDVFSFTAQIGCDSGIAVEIVFLILATVIHQQIFFFIDKL